MELHERHFETGIEFKDMQEVDNDTTNIESYLDRLERLNYLPFKGINIFFNDDLWDFSSFTSLNVAKKNLRFNFNRVNEEYRSELKKYVLSKVLENKMKLTSIFRHFGILSTYFNYLFANNIFSIKDATYSFLKNFLDEKDGLSYTTLRAYKTIIKLFYQYYEINFEALLTPEMDKILELGDVRIYKAVQKENKIPNIPDEFFDNLLQVLIKIVNTKDEPLHFRATACILLLLSQTGLRISEILSLEVDNLKTITILKTNEANYLKYKTWKREKGENIFSYERTYINPLAKKAFLVLKELHEERRNEIGSNYIYMGNVVFRDIDYYPVDADAFSKFQKQFYVYIDEQLPVIDLPIPNRRNLHTCNIPATLKRSLKLKGREVSEISYPKTQQFRVRACSELYHKGVPLKYIQKFMGHLSNEMQGYYVRPKDQIQENESFSKKTLEDLLTGKLTLLGSNSKDLIQRINDFIKSNNFQVDKDLNAIVNSLMKNIPIRQKLGGVCIKASLLRECSIDAKTNKYYCAYSVCPNVFHFFYNIDISYRKAFELSISIEINAKNGFRKQVQKETNMLKTVINKQLVPEMVELKKEITKRGIEELLMEYPDISNIMENLELVEQEVSEWKILANA